MTHELKKILQAYLNCAENGKKTVLATVVALDGSSYRRPGVRMLIDETGKMTGAVSGGCVEKEIWRQSDSVFKSGISKMMQYDGRYRLGCEGILYILIEPFAPDDSFINAFNSAIEKRSTINLSIYFSKKIEASALFGTLLHFSDELKLPVSSSFDYMNIKTNEALNIFHQEMAPCFRLVIIGAEHDAVQLCTFASLTGWEVTIVAPATDTKSIHYFPGATQLFNVAAGDIDTSEIDSQTAIVLMTHSFVNDLKFLISLKDLEAAYLGILGPVKRREKLIDAFLEHFPEIEDDFFDKVHGPAGLNIGAETPQEIAISILSEILSVVRDREPTSLRNKTGAIHSAVKI